MYNLINDMFKAINTSSKYVKHFNSYIKKQSQINTISNGCFVVVGALLIVNHIKVNLLEQDIKSLEKKIKKGD